MLGLADNHREKASCLEENWTNHQYSHGVVVLCQCLVKLGDSAREKTGIKTSGAMHSNC